MSTYARADLGASRPTAPGVGHHSRNLSKRWCCKCNQDVSSAGGKMLNTSMFVCAACRAPAGATALQKVWK
jgi:hypothetical protein